MGQTCLNRKTLTERCRKPSCCSSCSCTTVQTTTVILGGCSHCTSWGSSIFTHYIYIGLCTEWRFKKYRHGIYHCSWMFFCSFAAAWWRLLLVVLFVCNIIIYYCIAIIAFMIYKRTTYIYIYICIILWLHILYLLLYIYIYICMCVYTWTEVYMDVTTRKAPGASRTTCNRHSGVNLDLER